MECGEELTLHGTKITIFRLNNANTNQHYVSLETSVTLRLGVQF